MNPEILAKIMGIIAKTGERVIVIDPKSGAPFAILSLDEYEKLAIQPKMAVLKGIDPVPFQEYNKTSVVQEERGGAGNPLLTQKRTSGMIDPDLGLSAGSPFIPAADLGVDEIEQDRYYMEPAE